jgi:hypothetical protein
MPAKCHLKSIIISGFDKEPKISVAADDSSPYDSALVGYCRDEHFRLYVTILINRMCTSSLVYVSCIARDGRFNK